MIRDLTLPILSYFTGVSFSQARQSYNLVLIVFNFTSLNRLLCSFLTLFVFGQAVRQALGGSSSIEDLLIPFFCVSTNLSLLDQEVSSKLSATPAHHVIMPSLHSKEQIHENGKLWPAVRASMTVVGLMPPMSRSFFFIFSIPTIGLALHRDCRGRDLLVDGGYTDNLPLLQMVCAHVISRVF
jgi:predicted acylesterase/phospholipase RssA